eukprot:scaffold2199_cov120-Skeletonema_dohrnii-CCMP3373.AAC.2
MKKRKANDGRATADGTHDVDTGNTNDGGGFLSSWFGYFSGQREGASSLGPSPTENNTSQLDRMEQIMMRMEEKLATVSSLESRCETLEAKCSSLENMLKSTSQSTKQHIDEKYNSLCLHLDQKCNSLENRLETKVDTVHEKVERSLKFHEYNEMLTKNQSWEYSAAIHSMDEPIYDESSQATARHTMEDAQEMKIATTKMRTGEFPDERYGNKKGVHVEMYDYDTQDRDAVNNILLPHWKEFAAALKQFAPAMNLLPDEYESYFHFDNVQLNHEAMLLIKEALIGKPFQQFAFTNNDNGDDDFPAGMSVDAILDIVESNKRLRKLDIGMNRIGRDHIERLCSAVHTHPALLELYLVNCFEPEIGDAMLGSLLASDDLKLKVLSLAKNNITSGVSTVLADFLATNPRLKELNLDENYHLNDSDVALIANALRSNTTLKTLWLNENNITKVGKESLRLALCDDSSLNSAADSNHTCTVYLGSNDIGYNSHEQGQINRGRKIYSILSSRNETMSNVQHFGNIDVKILPIMLEAMQRYHNAASVYNVHVQKYATYVNKYEPKVKPLSIVYEVMRKWGVGNFET